MTKAKVFRADLYGLREGKYQALWETDVSTTEWEEVRPQTPFYLFAKRDEDTAIEYEKGWKVSDIFPVNSVGIVTARDNLTIRWTQDDIWQTVNDFAGLPVEEARQKYNLGKDARDWKVELAQKDLKASGIERDNLEEISYRPFDSRYTYYTGNSRGFQCMPRNEVMRQMLGSRNLGIHTCRQVISETWQHIFATQEITDDCYVSNKTRERGYLLPLYFYPDGSSLFDTGARRPNLSPEFIAELAGKVGLEFIPDGKGDLERTFGPEDVFNYIYAVFHAPSYRERYAEFLKIDFPRVPLTSSLGLFRTLTGYGETLVALHLMERVGSPISSYPVDGDNIVDKVSFTEEDGKTGRVYINKTQYFDGVPLTVWNFYVGGYQVCRKWLNDRKGRTLSYDDLRHYSFIVSALFETIGTMREIDGAIEAAGGWPLAQRP